MVEILQNQNSATRYRIMVEIVANQPNIQQKYIAGRLGITPQAVSDYVKQLLSDGLLISQGRSRYRLSFEGIDWLIRQTRAAEEYLASVEQVISNIRVSAAIADQKLRKGQKVGIIMREGLLFATTNKDVAAHGIAESDAEPGDDVGISNIQGIIAMETGEVTIAEVATVQRGGSKTVNLDRLRQEAAGRSPIIATGIEAITALKRIDIKPDYTYAAKEVAVHAARMGLSPLVVCLDEEIQLLLTRLKEAGVKHRFANLEKA
jgi:putative transcriptional regulator